MKNIFQRIIATCLICALFIVGMPLMGLATEEGTEPAPPSSAPVVEPAPEPKPEPEPQSAPDPEPEPAPEPDPEPEPQPAPEEDTPANDPSPDSEQGDQQETPDSSDEPDGEEPSTPPATDVEEKGNAIPDDAQLPENSPVKSETNTPTIESPQAPLSDSSSDGAAEDDIETEIFIVSFDTASLPEGKNVAYGTPETELGFPAILSATWSDGSVSDVKVVWQCISDGSGGSSYIPAHSNPAVVYTFKAALAEETACNAELPIIYIAYEAIAALAGLEPEPLVWEDVIVKVEEKEYEVNYKSIVLYAAKSYEFGLSCTEDAVLEPDVNLKSQSDDTEESYNIVLFEKLKSDTEYTVWARETGTELWTAFEKPIRTDAIKVQLTRDEAALGDSNVLNIGETIAVTTNLESPVFKWYREGQSEAVCDGNSYTVSLADVGAALKCVASEGDYSGETAGIRAIASAPVELRLDTVNESLTAVFAEEVPAGANVVLASVAAEVIASQEVTAAGREFKFENMRAQAGNTVQVYLVLNGAMGTAKEMSVLPLVAAPEKPGQDKIVFVAGSQRSIDFSCEEATRLEFAYRATGSEDALTLVSANPAVIDGLAAQTDYTLYMRSAASEAGFASEWVEAGFNATTDVLEVAVAQEDSIYFDSTIAASPARSYLFAEGYPSYQWYSSDEAVFNENATLLEDAHAAELNLQERGFTKADIGKYIYVSIADGYGNISVPKAVQLRRYDDPLLTLDVPERIVAGETVTAVYNGESAEITWEWRRGEALISEANTASYTVTAEDAYGVLTVNAMQADAVVATAYVAVDMCAVKAEVDYVQETVTVSVASPLPETWVLRAVDENGVSVDKAWIKGESSVSFKLEELGIGPDKHVDSAPDYAVVLHLMNAKGQGETIRLTLPTRSEYSEMTIDMSAVTRNSASELTFVVPAGFNMALSEEGASGPDFSLGNGPSFKNLKEGTRYTVWLRDAAVQGVNFASEWLDMHVAETGNRKEVSVSLKAASITWSPDWKFPDFEITKGDAKKSDIEYRWSGSAGGKAGQYTLELKLKSDAAKWYKLKNGKLTLTVEPIAMSAKNTRVTCEQLTYNGKEQLPQKMKVIVDGVEIPAGEFKTEKVSGYDCTKAGSHIIKVVGNGNVTGGIKILYVISKAKPAAISWPTAGFLTTGQKLSQSYLSGGSTNAGSFAWENGSIIPAAGISKHNVVFSPADTANYDWTGVTMVKPVEVRVYSVASSGDGTTGTDSDYSYDFSASYGYWDGGYEEEEEEYTDSSGDLAADYLSAGSGSSDVDALEIVYDVIGQPMDYELLAILREYEGDEVFTDHSFMVIAQPDIEGEIVSRFLRLNLAQLDYLYSDLDFSNLLFRNGDAELSLRLEEMFAGNVGKLAAYMLSAEESEIDPMDLDFNAMEDPVLVRGDLSGLWLEMRVDPIVITEEDETGSVERDAWDVSLWLCTQYTEVDISTLVSSFTIGLNVSGFMDESEQAQFLDENGIVLVDEAEAKMLLQSELIQTPGEMPADQPDEAEYYSVVMPEMDDTEVWTDYIPDMYLEAYRSDMLVTSYAGTGMYMLAVSADDF